jgi:hypothetical protein
MHGPRVRREGQARGITRRRRQPPDVRRDYVRDVLASNAARPMRHCCVPRGSGPRARMATARTRRNVDCADRGWILTGARGERELLFIAAHRTRLPLSRHQMRS